VSEVAGSPSRARTGTPLPARDFKSVPSTHSAATEPKKAAACAPESADEHAGSPENKAGEPRNTEHDPVELALAKAIEGATAAARWDVVSQLATELEIRRRAREESVVSLAAARKRRNGGTP
jgi:hypothetical protein